MVGRKGQLTIFIIIAVLIFLSIFLLIFMFSSTRENKSTEKPFLDSKINEDIGDCIQELSYDSIYFSMMQGGYYEVKSPKVEYFPLEIPIYWKNNQGYVPTLKEIENQISLFLKDHLSKCFYNESIVIDEIEIKILKGDVYFSFSYSFVHNLEDSAISFNSYDDFISFDILELYELVETFIEAQEVRGEYFPLSVLVEEAYRNDLSFEILELDSEVKIISIVSSELDERGPVVFNYALDYGSL